MEVEQFLKEYPELKIANRMDALKVLNTFEKEKILESEYFKKLKRFIFKHARKNSINPGDIIKLHYNIASKDSQLYKNSNPAQIYFSNLMRFIRYYRYNYPRNILYILETRPQIIFSNEKKNNHYESFLDQDFWVFFDPIYDLLNRRPGIFSQKIPFTFFSFSGTWNGIKIPPIDIFIKIYDEIQRHNSTDIEDIFLSLKILVSSKLKIDSTDKELKIILKIIPYLTDITVAKMLVKTNIRNLTDQDDIQKILREIMDIWYQNNFENDKQFEEYWKKTVDDGYKDLSNFYLFIKIYTKKGKPYIDNMLRENNNKPLINFQLENKAAYNVYNEKMYPYRKMILRVRPYADHNLAFSNEYFNLTIPKNKYILNNITIQSYKQLAIEIKKLSQKQKIDYIIISGHGNPKETHFGFDYNGLLNEQNLNDKLFDNISACFNKDAVCIMASCSTGKKSLFSKPIAKIISNKFGIKVIAPDKDSGSTVVVTEKGIDVDYEGAKKMSFNP